MCNIDELKPGRETDKLIAEKVMGHQVFEWNNSLFVASSNNAFESAITNGALYCFTQMLANDEISYCNTLPNYSTDISDAWNIAEKMRDDWVDFAIFHNDECRERWEVSWGFDGYGWPSAEAESASLAICKAALEAVGFLIEEK